MEKNDGIKTVVWNPSDETLAPCGHDDLMGYLTGLPCGECVRKAHRKAVGR